MTRKELLICHMMSNELIYHPSCPGLSIAAHKLQQSVYFSVPSISRSHDIIECIMSVHRTPMKI